MFDRPNEAMHTLPGSIGATDMIGEAHDQPQLRIVADGDCTVADLSALQGCWTEALYLKLTSQCNRLIEFTDGRWKFCPCRRRNTKPY